MMAGGETYRQQHPGPIGEESNADARPTPRFGAIGRGLPPQSHEEGLDSHVPGRWLLDERLNLQPAQEGEAIGHRSALRGGGLLDGESRELGHPEAFEPARVGRQSTGGFTRAFADEALAAALDRRGVEAIGQGAAPECLKQLQLPSLERFADRIIRWSRWSAHAWVRIADSGRIVAAMVSSSALMPARSS
jgi:hypothetical protein